MKVYELHARIEGDTIRITRAWGREGSELARIDRVCDLEAASRVLAKFERRRQRRGYVVIFEQRSDVSLERRIRWAAPSETSKNLDVDQMVLFAIVN